MYDCVSKLKDRLTTKYRHYTYKLIPVNELS